MKNFVLALSDRNTFIVFLMLFIPLLFEGTYYIYLGSLLAIYVIAALGLGLFAGSTNRHSFCQAALMGLGAYTVALILSNVDLSPVISFPFVFFIIILCSIATAAFGVLITYPAMNLKGPYFAMVSIAIAWVFWSAVIQWQPVTGGELGIGGFSPFDQSPNSRRVMYLALAAAFLCAVVVYQVISHSAFGLLQSAFRDDQLGLSAFGIKEQHMSAVIFFITSLFAGFAGGLFAVQQRFVNPDSFGVFDSVLLTMAVLVGGSRHVIGLVLGTFIVFILPQFFHQLDEYRLLFYGVLVLVVLNIARDGLVRENTRQAWRRKVSVSVESPISLPVIKPAEALVVDGVARRFGAVEAVKSASFTAKGGEIHGIIGPNGSGKTTLLDLISGLVARDQGSIQLDGVELPRDGMHNSASFGVSRTFQKIRNFASLTCRENVLVSVLAGRHRQSPVRLIAAITGHITAKDEARAEHALAEVGLADLNETKAGSLSQGQRRLLELARATVNQPKLLLLDEPTSGLDDAEIERLKELLMSFRSRGTMIIVVDHNLKFISSVCDCVTALLNGEVMAQGAPESVLRNKTVVETYTGGADFA